MDFLRTELWGGFTVLHLGGAVVGLFVLVAMFKALTKRDELPTGMIEVTCECGWHGRVGKYNRVCRKCNGPV